jgi:cytidylate kinase
VNARIITISRLFGSGGSEVARAVSAQLGWTLLDNAFIERIAAGLHATPAEVEALDEKGPTLAERLADALAYGTAEVLSTPVRTPFRPGEERLVAVTRQVIDEATSRGPIVVVGRGAQIRLEGRTDTLHVLCTAPHGALVARVAHRESLGTAEAAQRVDEENRRRAQFVRRHWDRDWLDASHYHLCVDTSWVGIEGAATLIAQLARRAEA